jgi:pentapeptide MXKDX repeat protein
MEPSSLSPIATLLFQQETQMRKIVLTAVCVAFTGLLATGVFAQTTGPAAQDSTKMGSEPKSGMSKEGTSGMSNGGMAKDNMGKDGMAKKDMSKDGMKKDDMKK